MEQPHRLVALHVAELMVRAARHEEHAVLLPLEALLAAALVPDIGDAASGDDVDDLVERELERLGRPARGDLAHARRSDALLPGELDEGAHALALFPPAELDGAQVWDEVAAMDRDARALHPVVVGEELAPHLPLRLEGGL